MKTKLPDSLKDQARAADVISRAKAAAPVSAGADRLRRPSDRDYSYHGVLPIER